MTLHEIIWGRNPASISTMYQGVGLIRHQQTTEKEKLPSMCLLTTEHHMLLQSN